MLLLVLTAEVPSAAEDRELAQLRLISEAAARDQKWQVLVDLEGRLRAEDPEWWPHLWAAMVAVAVRSVGGDGTSLLWEAVEGGFRQPEMAPLEPFRHDPQWPALAAAMAGPAPRPAIEIARWPGLTYGPALNLDTVPRKDESALREQLPQTEGLASAWEVARRLLAWVTNRWEHANDHVSSENAVEVLARVHAGERFACVEYSIVLGQALNAVGIPARRVMLRSRDHHVGLGRGHVVTEAWIDEFGQWVVLDGQNGAWWGPQEQPLGLRQLQRTFHLTEPRPEMHGAAEPVGPDDQDRWWTYFYSASVTGLTWDQPLVPLFQGQPAQQSTVVTPATITHPDLAECETATVPTAGYQPGLVFKPRHPYAIGVRVGRTDLRPGEVFDLAQLPPGVHDLQVRARTAFTLLAGQALQITRR